MLEEPHCPPSVWPCVRGSLELSPKQQAPCCLAPPQCPSLPKIEVLPGLACQLSIPKSAGRKVFPTAVLIVPTESCPKEIWQKCPPDSYN